jgi:hypothetical protein
MICTRRDSGLCSACQADYDEDPLAWIEFGDHPAGQSRWAVEVAAAAACPAPSPDQTDYPYLRCRCPRRSNPPRPNAVGAVLGILQPDHANGNGSRPTRNTTAYERKRPASVSRCPSWCGGA